MPDPTPENPNGYPEELLDALAALVKEGQKRIGHYGHRPAMTVRDLIMTLALFDPDALVVVDDIAGSGCAEPPVVRFTEVSNRPGVVEILTPGEAVVRDESRAGR